MNANILVNVRNTVSSLEAAVQAQDWPAAMQASDDLYEIRLAARGLTRDGWTELEQMTAQATDLVKTIPWSAQEAWCRR